MEQFEQYLMNRPIYTVHCEVKKHQNIIRLLQKTVNKKYGIQCCHMMDDTNNHFLFVSNTRDSSTKHFLHRSRPYFAGIFILFINIH